MLSEKHSIYIHKRETIIKLPTSPSGGTTANNLFNMGKQGGERVG